MFPRRSLFGGQPSLTSGWRFGSTALPLLFGVPTLKFLETLDSVCLRAKRSPDKRMRAACSAEQCRDACFNLALIKNYKEDFCCHFRRNDDPESDAPHECAITPDGSKIDLTIESTACSQFLPNGGEIDMKDLSACLKSNMKRTDTAWYGSYI